jgi:hypothetical protein
MRGGLVLALAIEFKPHPLDLAFEILDPPFEFRDGERRQTFTYRHAARFFRRQQIIEVHVDPPGRAVVSAVQPTQCCGGGRDAMRFRAADSEACRAVRSRALLA